MKVVRPPIRSGPGESRGNQMRGAIALARLLTELARALLPAGMTPKRLSELVRYAFAQAAADVSRLQNGRVNHSRVAAQTALSRAVVKRLLNNSLPTRSDSDRAPIERVIDAWRTDPQFSSGYGEYRPLQISGRGASFKRLVRKYGGDVPYRAVLDELRRMGVVSGDTGLVRLTPSSYLRRRHDFTFLSPIVPILVEGIRIASGGGDSRRFRRVHRLSVPVRTEADLTLLQNRWTSTAKAIVDGLVQSARPIVSSQREQKLTCSLIVTVQLAASPSRGAARSRPATPKRRSTVPLYGSGRPKP